MRYAILSLNLALTGGIDMGYIGHPGGEGNGIKDPEEQWGKDAPWRERTHGIPIGLRGNLQEIYGKSIAEIADMEFSMNGNDPDKIFDALSGAAKAAKGFGGGSWRVYGVSIIEDPHSLELKVRTGNEIETEFTFCRPYNPGANTYNGSRR